MVFKSLNIWCEKKILVVFMKDLVSLMKKTNNLLDVMSHLSLSSIFLNDKNISKITLELYGEFKKTRIELYRLIFSLRGVKKDTLVTITDIMEIQSDLADSYSDRAHLVLEKSEIHPVLKKVFGEEDKRAFVTVIKASSSIDRKNLLEMGVRQKTGAMILAIKRNEKWIILPGPKDKIKINDLLICLGDQKSLEIFEKVSKGTIRL